MTPFKTDYHTSKIYYICLTRKGVEQLYTGSTINSIEKRLVGIKVTLIALFFQCKASIKLLCNAPCRDKA